MQLRYRTRHQVIYNHDRRIHKWLYLNTCQRCKLFEGSPFQTSIQSWQTFWKLEKKRFVYRMKRFKLQHMCCIMKSYNNRLLNICSDAIFCKHFEMCLKNEEIYSQRDSDVYRFKYIYKYSVESLSMFAVPVNFIYIRFPSHNIF